MASDNVIHVNDGNYDSEVLKSSLPVLIDFSASWCGPCHVVAPLIDQLADEYKDRFKVAKVDVDESPNVARKHGIRGIPTLIVIKNGNVFDQMVGAAPKAQIAALMERALSE
ncbi:MAG: thioredoxin [Deltaproteobacteria bacterium]|nr:thioredoxin [Deltaproteobacteria bacterium]